MMKLKKPKAVAIDFDETIVEYDGEWRGPEYIGDLKEDEHPKECLTFLKQLGFTVIIYTCRSDLQPVYDFLEEKEIPYDFMNKNPDEPETTSDKKLYAWRYIDNRNANYRSLPHSTMMIIQDAIQENLFE